MSQQIRVLLAEDETALGIIIKESLESRDFAVDLHHDGEAVMKAYRAEVPDVLVLDVMMPKKDGFTLARDIRKENPNVPIIFLTAKSRTEDVVEGFGHGANDYIKKPFSMEELIVRIKALVKRPQQKPTAEEWLKIGTYDFHLSKQLLRQEQREIPLTYREAQLLHALYLNKNELSDRSLILNKLWGNDDFFNARSMDVFITKLRKKLQEDPNIQILNIRGYGYKLVC
jgi:DNA-binding response OmpR family regulator